MSATVYLPYTHQCFVCGANNPHGLRLRFRVEDGEIRADFRPRTEHAGYKGIVHGGIVASALDEIMFWAAAYARREFFVSVEMSTRWTQKVIVGAPYRLVGRLEREQRKFCFAQAEVRDADGQVCATASGKYYPMPPAEVPLGVEDFCIDPQTLAIGEFFGKPEVLRRYPSP